MASQDVDIFSMLHKAQSEYNQQQNSVAAFFSQANTAAHNNAPVQSRPMPISAKLSSLEQIERQIRVSPPSQRNSCNLLTFSSHQAKFVPILEAYHHNNNNNSNNNGLRTAQPNPAISPLAQFFNSNNFNNNNNNRGGRPAGPHEGKPKEQVNGHKVSAPPGFNTRVQPPKNLLNGSKETKLITPAMFAATNNPSSINKTDKKPSVAEPLTKNQLLQAMNYLIENDDEFMKKVHEAYIKSFRTLAS